jgi:hypothetical protein
MPDVVGRDPTPAEGILKVNQGRIETRASYMKVVLAGVERRGSALEQQLKATSPHTLSAIRAASPADWLPHQIGLDMARSLEQVIGTADTRAIYLEACLSSFQSGILGPLFGAAVRIFGPSPDLVARWVPRAWNAVWRGCGELVVEEARPGYVRIHHVGIPPEAMFDAFLDVAAECIGSIIVGCEKKGSASVERRGGSDPIGYVLRWEER